MSNPRKHVSVEGHEFITPSFKLSLPTLSDFSLNGNKVLTEVNARPSVISVFKKAAATNFLGLTTVPLTGLVFTEGPPSLWSTPDASILKLSTAKPYEEQSVSIRVEIDFGVHAVGIEHVVSLERKRGATTLIRQVENEWVGAGTPVNTQAWSFQDSALPGDEFRIIYRPTVAITASGYSVSIC